MHVCNVLLCLIHLIIKENLCITLLSNYYDPNNYDNRGFVHTQSRPLLRPIITGFVHTRTKE